MWVPPGVRRGATSTSPCICFHMSEVTTPRISVRGVPRTIFSNAQTERTVASPKIPSMGPGSKFRAASAACIASTSDPTIPWKRSWVSSGTGAGAVVVGATSTGSGGGGVDGGGVVVVVVVSGVVEEAWSPSVED